MNRRELNAGLPIVNQNGTMSMPFMEYQLILSQLIPDTGAGSPEGVVEAPQFSSYYDTTASAGSIHYIKMLADIGGDRTQGWKLA